MSSQRLWYAIAAVIVVLLVVWLVWPSGTAPPAVTTPPAN
jgi:hypothetical protein